MNMLLRHVRGQGCVGTIDMVTAEVRTAITEDTFNRYSSMVREVVGQIRDVQNEAREHMLIGQKEERRATRVVRRKLGCDRATIRSYVLMKCLRRQSLPS